MASGGTFQLIHALFLLLLLVKATESATFTLVNNCEYTVWPGILSNAGIPQLSTTGFALQPSQSKVISFPTAWSGRLWGRTICTQDPTTTKFTCLTGDCGSGTVECSGAGAVPPATLAEFTLNAANGLDFYDVSLVDGYNLPMLVARQNQHGGNCSYTGCAVDLNKACPIELKVSGDDGQNNVACKSACNAFGAPQYCCSGAYATPDTCKPSTYSDYFKAACPSAYSYAYDDGTSTFTCAAADYLITFCPSPSSTSQKKTGGGDDQIEKPIGTDILDSSPPIAGVIHNSAAALCHIRSLSHVPTTFVVLAVVILSTLIQS